MSTLSNQIDYFFMRIITLNANGIRSSQRKGFFRWFSRQRADVLCLQEVRASEDQLDDKLFNLNGYHRSIVPAEKAGYSGVAIYAKAAPVSVNNKMECPEFDKEGRFVEYVYKNISIISCYFPSGSSSEERQDAKYRFLRAFENTLSSIKKNNREFIICGDLNIAHTNKDIKNWKGNKKNSGFLPEERAWLDRLYEELGCVDAFRCMNQDDGQYTWWSNRGRARENNVGWRIDYQVISPGLSSLIKKVRIYKDVFFSDHAPLIIDYSYSINE
jgi:exodeoxyribonuclease-3